MAVSPTTSPLDSRRGFVFGFALAFAFGAAVVCDEVCAAAGLPVGPPSPAAPPQPGRAAAAAAAIAAVAAGALSAHGRMSGQYPCFMAVQTRSVAEICAAAKEAS